MALIKCPECGKEISDKASTCINCGSPVNNQSDENIVDNPTVTVVEHTKQKAQKKFFTAMILNAIATGILVFIMLVLYLNSSKSTIEHISSLRDFLLVYPIATIIILIIAFAFSLLTYLIKNRKKNIFAIGSAIFSIISCLLCFVLSTEYLCELIIVLPSGILYFISALLTLIGIKEYSAC